MDYTMTVKIVQGQSNLCNVFYRHLLIKITIYVKQRLDISANEVLHHL